MEINHFRKTNEHQGPLLIHEEIYIHIFLTNDILEENKQSVEQAIASPDNLRHVTFCGVERRLGFSLSLSDHP